MNVATRIMIRHCLEIIDAVLRWSNPFIVTLAGLTGFFASSSPLSQFWKPTGRFWIDCRDMLQEHMATGFVVLSGISMIAALGKSILGPSLRSANARVDQLEVEKALLTENFGRLDRGYLVELATKLDFQENKGTDRLSLYVVSRQNDCFVPCARYSTNPNYGKKGRVTYPIDQGCIGKAWESGWHYDASFPDYAPAPDSEYAHYCLAEYNIDGNVLSEMSMKPHCIVAMAIPRKQDHEHLAVLVLESAERKRFPEDTIRPFLEQQRPFLTNLVETLYQQIALPDTAAQRGF